MGKWPSESIGEQTSGDVAHIDKTAESTKKASATCARLELDRAFDGEMALQCFKAGLPEEHKAALYTQGLG